jgi:hypothetical protein
MTQNARIRFLDIVRLKKDEPIPDGANKIVRDALGVMCGGVVDKFVPLNECLEKIELGKWYGVWSTGGAEFTFRHGVCQNFTKRIDMNFSEFKMNIINTSIDFRKEPK